MDTTAVTMAFQVADHQVRLQLCVPLQTDVADFVRRVVDEHNLPPHLAPTMASLLCSHLAASMQGRRDCAAAVAAEGADLLQLARAWAGAYRLGHSTYAPSGPADSSLASGYHQLIHSAHAAALAQLEATYDRAMREIGRGQRKALGQLKSQHEGELREMIGWLQRHRASEADLQALRARHDEERHTLRAEWESRRSAAMQAQRQEYASWVLAQSSSGPDGTGPLPPPATLIPSREASTESDVGCGGREESFTIHLGAQLKTSHNLQLGVGDPLTALSGTAATRSHATALMRMALYSQAITGHVLLVDRTAPYTDPVGRGFLSLCEATSELHFEPIGRQLEAIRAKVGAMQAGDFYITRHSNLPGTHVVFHLVTDPSAAPTTLAQRSPAVGGLRNILTTASQHGVTTLLLPLLLAYTLPPAASDAWCLARAELVLKCIKAFLIECSAWGGMQDTRTLQFQALAATAHLFDAMAALVTSVFKVAQPLALQPTSSS